MNRSKFLTPLLFSLLLIASCNLTKGSLAGRGASGDNGGGSGGGEDNLVDLPKPIFDEDNLADLPKPIFDDNYDPESPLYKATVTGVGSGDNKLFITTDKGELWQKDLTNSLSRVSNPWINLTSQLPAPFTKIVVITELSGGTQSFAYVALSNDMGTETGLYAFSYLTSSFGLVGTMQNQKPLKFFEMNTDASHSIMIYLYTISSTGSGEKFVYDTGSQEVTPRDANGNRPMQNNKILGNFDSTGAFLVSTQNLGQDKYYEIWYNTGSKPVSVQAGEAITMVGAFKFKGQYRDAIATISGNIYPVDTSTGSLDEANKIVGMGTRLAPTGLRYIDRNPVVTSKFGYFEVADDAKLIHPTAITTDTISYAKNGLKNIKILGIRALNNKKIYMRTEKNGLWERDPLTKKWVGV